MSILSKKSKIKYFRNWQTNDDYKKVFEKIKLKLLNRRHFFVYSFDILDSHNLERDVERTVNQNQKYHSEIKAAKRIIISLFSKKWTKRKTH